MRAFIAINLPEIIKKQIRRTQDRLPEFTGKKTEGQNLHLTLKFLGELDETKTEQVRKRLERIKFPKFEAEINETGFFDNQKYGVVWISLKNCDKLQKAVDEALSDIFEKERRFMSHITIARVKTVKDKREFLKQLSDIKMEKKRFLIDKIFLMKSVLGKNGPKYSVLQEYPLD